MKTASSPASGSARDDLKQLLWADIQDIRTSKSRSVRGVRFFTNVELQAGMAFILEGLEVGPEYIQPARRRFVASTFMHALDQCVAFRLKEPKLFVYLSTNPDYSAAPMLAAVTEVHGQQATGPLVLKLQSGESIMIASESVPIPAGLLKRLFPPIFKARYFP